MKDAFKNAVLGLAWKSLIWLWAVTAIVGVLMAWNIGQAMSGGVSEWNLIGLAGGLIGGSLHWGLPATILSVVFLLLVSAGVWALVWVLPPVTHKDAPDEVKARAGLARHVDLAHKVGKEAAVAKAHRSLVLPDDVDENDVVTALCALDGQQIYFQHEESMWVFAPQRSGKTLWIAVGIVIDAPGPVMATSTKVDLFMLTALMRSGELETTAPVQVFDLQGMTDWPGRVQWDVVAGCEDPDEALARGKAWAGAQPMNGVKGGDWFNSKAAAILGRYLHAAALDGKNMIDILRWANDFTDPEPLEILRRSQRGLGFADRLESLITSRAGETVDSIQETLAGLLEPLSSPKAMHTLTPARGQGFDVESFLNSNGTLYLLADGETSPVAPIVTMFADHVFRKSQKISQKRPGGRLWPPLTMVLDEAPNVAAFPEMASALSDSGGRGIRIIGFSQSFAQNRGRWGDINAESIRGTSSVRLLLPGLEDLRELDRFASAAGMHMVERQSRSVTDGKVTTSYRMEETPVIRGYEIQQMREGEAFMHHSNLPPTIVDLIPYWERHDADTIKERKKTLEESLHTNTPVTAPTGA